MEKDFYLLHLKNETKIIETASQTNIIKIIPLQCFTITPNYVCNNYYVEYLKTPIFDFFIYTYNDPMESKIKKNKRIFKIEYEKSINEFINACILFVNQLIQDHEKINQNFYINNNTNFLDEIRLKKTFLSNNSENTRIEINMDGSYLVYVSLIDSIEYNNIVDVMESHYLQKLRKNILHNILSLVGLF